MANNFKESLVGAGGVFVLDVKHGVDEVFPHQRAEAVFEAEACEESRFLRGGLRVEIEFGRPPGANAVFELTGCGAVAVAVGGLGEGGFGLDFEISGLLKVVGIGDEVGLLLGAEAGMLP